MTIRDGQGGGGGGPNRKNGGGGAQGTSGNGSRRDFGGFNRKNGFGGPNRKNGGGSGGTLSTESGFRGTTPGLEDAVFTYGTTKDAATFEDTLKKLARHLG